MSSAAANAVPASVGEDNALGASIIRIRLADDVAQPLEIVDELPDRMRRDFRPDGDRRQASATVDINVGLHGQVRGTLRKARSVDSVDDVASKAHGGEPK